MPAKKFTRLNMLLLALFGACSVFAQEKNMSFSLEECLQFARKNNEAVAIQVQNISQADQRLRQASGMILPNLSFGVQQYWGDNQDNTVAGEGASSRFYLTQPLFYGSRLAGSIRIARLNKRIAELQLMDTYRNLDSEVASAFYSLAQVDSDLKNNYESIEKMSERSGELKRRIKLGKSRESELYLAELQISILRSNEQRFKGDRIRAAEALAFLTGTDAASMKVADTSAEIRSIEPVEKFIDMALSRSDILEADESVNQQALRVKTVKGALLPTVDLNGSIYTSRTGALSGGDWNVNLLAGMPLFQGGAARARIKEEKSKLEETQQSLSLSKRRLKSDIRQLYASLQSSIDQVLALKEAYGKAQKNYKLQINDYQLGLVNNLDVIQATMTLLDIKSALDRVELQVKLDKALLDFAVK